MAYKSGTSKATTTFNKHGLHVRWPRIWIVLIGLILVFLTFAIAGMEVGHTIYDVYRSTAFGGFIAFLPLLLCALFVLITACLPKLFLLRITAILCCLMVLLCIALITYDVFVIVDPSRCFFLNCNLAITGAVSGWPISVTWPTSFQLTMNIKRVFQSIQMLCSGLYILFAMLYILTYLIYRHIKVQQHQTPYNVSRGLFPSYDTNRASARRSNVVASSQRRATAEPSPRPVTRTLSRNSNYVPQSYSHLNPNSKVTVYTIEGQADTLAHRHYPPAASPIGRTTATPTKSKGKTFIRPRASSVDDGRLCTRCNREPRLTCATHYERQNYFSHLCVNCNDELANEHRKTPHPLSRNNRHWVP